MIIRLALVAIAASSDHASIGRPPILCSGFGSADLRRVPCPAARMIAAIFIVFIYAFSSNNAKHLQKKVLVQALAFVVYNKITQAGLRDMRFLLPKKIFITVGKGRTDLMLIAKGQARRVICVELLGLLAITGAGQCCLTR